MLQLITKDKVKTIILSVCILFSVSLVAQNDKTTEKSTIVMTKSELNSFLTTVADARRAQINERESRRIKQDLAELRLKYQQGSMMNSSGQEVSNQQLLNEIRYLNQRIDNMNGYSNQSRGMSRDNSTIIMPGNAGSNQAYPLSDRGSTTIVPSGANAKKLKELQFKMDSIKSLEANRNKFRNDKSYADSLNNMKGNLADLKRNMADLEAKMLASKKVVITEEITESTSYFTQQVYFDNNSEKLNDEYLKYVQDLTQILINYPEAKVMLEGWASPVGKAAYNKQLSMRRAESVEKAFINNRIDQSRILTSFKGEDKTGSAQHARRVDMSIVIQ